MNLAASSFDAASASQESLKDAYFDGLNDELHKIDVKALMMSLGNTSLLLKSKIVGVRLPQKQFNPAHSLVKFRQNLNEDIANKTIAKIISQSLTGMPAATRRIYGEFEAVLQANPSKQTATSKSDSAIRGKCRIRLHCRPKNRMELI